jgi:hypothetical protein
MDKRVRQYIGIIAAILTYYVVHEGAHFICAVILGVFKQINFMGVGVQIDVYREKMTDNELGIFCLVGAVATLLVGYVLVFFARRICESKSKLKRATSYYMTISLLLLDPLYLSLICSFVGGGDMNGIKLMCPEAMVRVIFGIIFVTNGLVFRKKVLPNYKMSFKE